MVKKIKKLVAFVDDQFYDCGTKTIAGIEVHYSTHVSNGQRRFVYSFSNEELRISTDVMNSDIEFMGKFKTFKRIYKTLCTQ